MSGAFSPVFEDSDGIIDLKPFKSLKRVENQAQEPKLSSQNSKQFSFSPINRLTEVKIVYVLGKLENTNLNL